MHARFQLEEGMRIIESMEEGRSMTYAIERLCDNIEEKDIKIGDIVELTGLIPNNSEAILTTYNR